MLEFFMEIFGGLRDILDEAIEREDAGKVVARHGRDVTKKIDAVAEDFVLQELSSLNATVITEERGVIPSNKPELIAVVDPLDGSFNALHSIPFYALSIALAPYNQNPCLNHITYGFVGNLATGDYFYAEAGKGSYFNGKKIKIKDLPLNRSTLVLYTEAEKIKELSRLLSSVKRIRSLGCASLEMCFLAKGDFQLFIDSREYLRNVDVAAGILIAREAGATITDLKGRELKTGIKKVETLNVLAGAPKAHSQAIELIIN